METHRIIMCGDRAWLNKDAIVSVLESLDPNTVTIVHGACRGADRIAGNAAFNLGFTVEQYPALWHRYKGGAGPIRNQQMLDTGIDRVYAFHPDISKSKGTKHMVSIATKASVPVVLITGETDEHGNITDPS